MTNFKKLEDLRTDATGGKVFVIGSCMGHSGLLFKMLTLLENYPLARNDKIVVMGNSIGPIGQSKQVLQVIKNYTKHRKGMMIPLMGLNENLFARARPNFMLNPLLGKRIVKSYLIPKKYEPETMSMSIPDINLDRSFVSTFKPFYESDTFFICSGGVNPAKKLDDQFVGILLHGHKALFDNSFLSMPLISKRVIVCNTAFASQEDKKVIDRPKVCKDFINLASSPHLTNKLFCAVLDDKTTQLKEMLQVSA